MRIFIVVSSSAMAPNRPGHTGKATTATVLAGYHIFGEDIEALLAASDARSRPAYLIGPLGLYHHFDPAKAIEFMRQFTTLEDLSSPVRIFRKWHERHHVNDRIWNTLKVAASCIKHFHNGQSNDSFSNVLWNGAAKKSARAYSWHLHDSRL